jgi:hypothetical protein
MKDNTQCDAEKTKHYQKSSSKNTQSNWGPFKCPVFCRLRWTFGSGAKGLTILWLAWPLSPKDLNLHVVIFVHFYSFNCQFIFQMCVEYSEVLRV